MSLKTLKFNWTVRILLIIVMEPIVQGLLDKTWVNWSDWIVLIQQYQPSCHYNTELKLKGNHVTRNSIFMFWINFNDYACAIVYQSNKAV